MTKTKAAGWLAALLAVLFLMAGCGGQAEDRSEELKAYINENLPESYVSSEMYKTQIKAGEKAYSARILLDMCADGSSYDDYSEADFLEISELEAGYLLVSCIGEPPVPTDFTLQMVFGGDYQVIVTKTADQKAAEMKIDGQTEITPF